jgi:hypothetical protein
MAQSGYTPIQLYYSTTAAAVPLAGNLNNGELGINITDGKLYYKNNGGTVTLLASTAGASGDVVGPASSTDNALARFDLATGKLIQNSVGILSDAGVLTGLTGLTSSGSITLSSLTSGRVTYAGTSGLLQDSANLTFSGSALSITGSVTATTGATIGGRVTLNGVGTSELYTADASGLYLTAATSAGMYVASDGAFYFRKATTPFTNYMTLDSAGNLGVGATPSAKFQVKVATNGNFAVTTPNSGTGARIWVVNDAVSAVQRLELQGNPVVFPLTTGADGMYFDASAGNLGLGVTPAAWNSGYKVIQVGNGTGDGAFASGSNITRISTNIYRNATPANIYISTAAATEYIQSSGTHQFTIAPSGTSGTAATFTNALTINGSGAFGVGSGTSYGSSGQVLTSGGSGAAPTWTTVSSASVAGSNTQVQYNNSGAFGASANFTYASGTLSSLATTSSAFYAEANNGYALFDGATTSSNARFNITAGSTAAGVTLYGYNSSRTGYTPLNYSASEQIWKIGSTEYMRLDAAGKISLTGGAVPTEGQVYINNGNTSGNPDRALYVNRPYNQFPGKTANYYGIYSWIQGFDQDGTFNSAAVYGRCESQGAPGILGSGSGVTAQYYAIVAIANGNTDGYAYGYAYTAKFVRSGTGANGGYVGYYCEDPNYLSTGQNTIGFYWNSLYTGANTKTIDYYVRNGTAVGSITCSTTTTSYNTSSDYRLKENVVPLTGALDRVARMKPVTYKWKLDQTDGEGFIAHELAEVVPHAVNGTKDETRYEKYVITPEVANMVTIPAEHDSDGNEISPERQEKVVITPAEMGGREVPVYQGVDTSFLVATLTAAIQEQQALIVALTARLDALEAK